MPLPEGYLCLIQLKALVGLWTWGALRSSHGTRSCLLVHSRGNVDGTNERASELAGWLAGGRGRQAGRQAAAAAAVAGRVGAAATRFSGVGSLSGECRVGVSDGVQKTQEGAGARGEHTRSSRLGTGRSSRTPASDEDGVISFGRNRIRGEPLWGEPSQEGFYEARRGTPGNARGLRILYTYIYIYIEVCVRARLCVCVDIERLARAHKRTGQIDGRCYPVWTAFLFRFNKNAD